MDFLLKIGRNISDLVRRMSWMQRLSVVALVVVLIAAVSVLISYSIGTEWVPLFDRAAMGPEDAKEAMRRIEESGVRYREVGGQVSVPKESRYRLASTTFLFDRSFSKQAKQEIYNWLWVSDFGETTERLRLRYQYSREADLAICIRSIPEVEDVSVKITEAKKRLIFQQEEPSKASVILKLKAGIERLPRERVEGIARLLEGSVSNLKAENVNIIADGRPYRMPPEDSEFAAGTLLMEQKVNAENHLARKIEKAIGIGEAIVTIDIDKEQIAELREEGPDSDKTMIESVKVSKEETTGEKSGGRIGARPASGKQGTAITGAGTTHTKEEFEAFAYPYIKFMRQLPTPGLPGKMGNVSATLRVALTDIPFQSGIVNFDFGCTTHTTELEDWKNKTKTVVKNICQTSLDKVAINVVPTKRIVQPEIILTTWQKIAGWWAEHWSKAMLGLLAMIAVIFVAYSVTKTAPREVRTEEVATVAMLEGTDVDEEEEEEEEEEEPVSKPKAKLRPDEPEITLDEPEVSVRDQRLTLMKAKVQEAVAEDPRKVAALLRSWIRQEL